MFPAPLPWLVRATAVVGVVAGLGASASVAGRDFALPACECHVVDSSIDAEEWEFLALINDYRAAHGLRGLSVSTNLNRAATWMAVDLALNGYFSHTDSAGRSPSQRALDCRYPQGAGENLAAGNATDTARKAFDAWKASPEHDANMLTASYRQIGVARHYSGSSTYGWYWVTNFGVTNDGTASEDLPLAPANETPAPPSE